MWPAAVFRWWRRLAGDRRAAGHGGGHAPASSAGRPGAAGAGRDAPARAAGGAGHGGQGAGILGSVADLLAASVLVSAFSARDRDEQEQAARKPPAKEDNRAAC